MTIKTRFENAQPVGACHITNAISVVIFDINHAEDTAVVGYSTHAGYSNIRTHKINTTSSGRFYIRKGNARYYFDNMMRI